MRSLSDCAFHAEVDEVDTPALYRLLRQHAELMGLEKWSRCDADIGGRGAQRELLGIVNHPDKQGSTDPTSLMFRRDEKTVNVSVTRHVGEADGKAVSLCDISQTSLEPL